MEVRDLAWRDFDGWVDLYLTRYDELRTNPELWVNTYESPPPLSDQAVRFGKIWKDVLSGDMVSSVTEDGRKLLGVCSVYRTGQHQEDRHSGILAISVHPAWRGRGVGSGLISHVLRKCEGKFEVVHLTVTEANLRARALYAKFGFAESGRLPRAFKRGEQVYDDILMWRAIENPHRTST